MEIKQIDIDLIKTYWRNPRRSEEAIGFVAESIKRYGFMVPIVVDSKMVIITGHTRYRAARQNGLTKLPVIVADLSEAQARQFRIADNKTSERAQWNMDLLVKELREMESLDEVRRLFGGPEWDRLLDPEQFQVQNQNNGSQLPDAAPGPLTIEVTCPHCGKDNNFLVE